MAYKNNSTGKSYYTQRNNKIRPGEACTVTSMTSALSAAGWPVDDLASGDRQPEDMLMTFIMSDPVCGSRWRYLDPAGKTPPNEWHEVLALGANRWLKTYGFDSNPVTFRVDITIASIKEAIDSGGAAVLSGSFPYKDSRINHVVSVVGHDDDGLILDDPWGDYRDKYETTKGDDIPLTRADFTTLIKPLGSPRKLGHIIARYEA